MRESQSTICVCFRPKPTTSWTLTFLTKAVTLRRLKTPLKPKPSQKFCILQTLSTQAKSSVSFSNISLFPVPFRTLSAVFWKRATTSATCRTKSAFSWTTPTRPSQLQSWCVCWLTFTDKNGTPHGTSRPASLPIPTIPCCRKRWKPGRRESSVKSCRATCRLFMKSTAVLWILHVPSSGTTEPNWAKSQSFPAKAKTKLSEWRICPLSALSRLTAWRKSTPNSSRPVWFPNFTNYGLKNSATLPTESRRAVGCCTPTRLYQTWLLPKSTTAG